MTREDIIKFGREAGFADDGVPLIKIVLLERFATLVADSAAAKEREACAQIADAQVGNTMLLTSFPPKSAAAFQIAAAIRARGQQ